MRSLTDTFQLDTIHTHILSKLTSQRAGQPHFLLADQPMQTDEHNTFFVQITVPKLSAAEKFSFDVIYQSDSSQSEREQDLTGTRFDEELLHRQALFDERFERIFELPKKYNITAKHIAFARSTLSNLLGGISYFTGKSLSSPPQILTPFS